tara:strand:- start:9042 stop:9161 length:120 start_codon:yes stop_codon:yes gene_type:complete
MGTAHPGFERNKDMVAVLRRMPMALGNKSGCLFIASMTA